MDYQVVKKIDINKERCVKIGEFLYDKEVDGLYLESPWPFPVQIGMTENLSKCQITPGFLRLPFILKGWVNEQILLRLVDLLALVQKGRILMHGSVVDNTLIVGFPNAGKTYQTFKMVQEGGQLISEELTIIDNGDAYAYNKVTRTCFSPSTVKDCGIKLTFVEKIKMFFSGIRAFFMPFMFEHAIWKEYTISPKSAKIEKIVYGSSGREVTDWKEFAILCENEFPFMASEFLQAYAVATGLDILDIQKKQRKLIKDFVESVYK